MTISHYIVIYRSLYFDILEFTDHYILIYCNLPFEIVVIIELVQLLKKKFRLLGIVPDASSYCCFPDLEKDSLSTNRDFKAVC